MTALPHPPEVILIEDDDVLREALCGALVLQGLAPTAFADPRIALEHLTPDFRGVIVSDIRMPGLDGLELLRVVHDIDADLPIILITGHGDVAMAVKALHDGAFDFLAKPFATDHLAASIRRASEHRTLVLENRQLRAAMEQLGEAEVLVGESGPMAALRGAIRRFAQADVDVLVEGETGTGKELVARLLHREGPRRGRPFIAVNCGTIGEASALELFGHAADSVPHTRMSRQGLIAESSGGTLLLDEVDLLPLGLQAQLLRVLEEREVQPLGAARPVAVQLRVVATTKTDIAAAISEGRFREDLFYRLAVVRLSIPPVRERGNDTAELFARFLAEAEQLTGTGPATVDHYVHLHLRNHTWPGNVRELRNFAFSVALGNRVAAAPPATKALSLKEEMQHFEAESIRRKLTEHSGNIQLVAAQLQLPVKTLYDKINRYGIVAKAFRSH